MENYELLGRLIGRFVIPLSLAFFIGMKIARSKIWSSNNVNSKRV